MRPTRSPLVRFSPNALGLAISAALMGPVPHLMASTITPTAGPGGTPIIEVRSNVPVIDIVAPNPQGLSHNRYLDYNVGVDGVIINNSLVGGRSRLQIDIPANRQFGADAASTILNEVSGARRSDIHGAQEIFGQAVDYVLSNPNGIWVNGGWIHTKPDTTATLLVGKPEVLDGRLTGLDSREATGALLVGRDGMGINNGSLRMISPDVRKNGMIHVAGDLEVIAGRQQVDASSSAITAVAHDLPAIDAHLLGAMSANRIRIVTTHQGAGIHMPISRVAAREGIDIEAGGSLHLTTMDVPTAKLERGLLYTASGDVRLRAGQDVDARAVSVSANNIMIDAGRSLITGTSNRNTHEVEKTQTANAWIFLPGGKTVTQTQVERRQSLGTQLGAQQDIALRAGADIVLKGAQVVAGRDLSLEAAQRLEVEAAKESSRTSLTVNDRSAISSSHTELVSSQETLVGGDLQAGAQLTVKAGTATFAGSRLSGQNVTLTSTAGDLSLTGISTESRDLDFSKSKQALKKKDLTLTTQSSRHQGTEVAASADANLSSHGKITLQGATLQAGHAANLNGAAGIELLAGNHRFSTTANGTDWKLSVFAEQTKAPEDGRPGSLQWVAGAGVKREHVIDTSTIDETASAKINANSINLQGGPSILAHGAKLEGKKDLVMAADDVQLLAAQDTVSFSNSLTGKTAGMQWTGGLDRAGAALFVEDKTLTDGNRQVLHQSTSLKAGDRLQIDAGSLVNVATQMDAKGALNITAETIDNGAATDIVSSQINRESLKATAGASVDYGDIARTVYKAVAGQEQTRFQQQGVADNLAPFSVGVEVTADYQKRNTQALHHLARATRIEGGNTTIVAKRIQDQSTHYSSAEGTTVIRAGRHELAAAHSTLTTSLNRLDVETLARVEAFTPVDFGVKLTASGYGNDRTEVFSVASAGSISGKRGVQIQLGTDGLYEGTRFASEMGDIEHRAGGNLKITQANDRHELIDYTGQGKGSLKVGFGETTGIAISASGNGVYSDLHSIDTNAVAGSYQTPGKVVIQTGRNLLMQGTQIGTRNERAQEIDVSAGGTIVAAAARSTHLSSGQVYGGGGNFKVGGVAGKSKSLEVGGSIQIGRTLENSTLRSGGTWYATDAARLMSRSDSDEAIYLSGLSISAEHIALQADYGGIRMTAATSEVTRNNREGAGGFGIGGTAAKDVAKDTAGLYARAAIKYDKMDSTTHANTQLRGKTIDLQSASHVVADGASLQADTIDARIGGDLQISSLQDNVDGLLVNADVRGQAAHNPLAILKSLKSIYGPFSDKISGLFTRVAAKAESKAEFAIDMEVVKQSRNTAAQPSGFSARQGMTLAVEGATTLVGATLEAPRDNLNVNTTQVNKTTLVGDDYYLGMRPRFATSLLSAAKQVYDSTRDRPTQDTVLNFPLLKIDLRDKRQTLTPGIKTLEM